ncbi:hypothetical protein Tco_0639889 [Tanacetum coccineum]
MTPDVLHVDGREDSGGNPKPKLFVVHLGSVAARIKDRKCKTRGGSSRPPVKRKIAPRSSTSRATHAKTSSLMDDAPFLIVSLMFLSLKIPLLATSRSLDNHMDLELLDLHDRCYERQTVVDNAVNRRSHELLNVIKKLRGEFDVMRSRERAREEEYEGLRVKCEAAMTEVEKNPVVMALREKIYALSTEVTSLEAGKTRLEVIEVALRKEVEELKQDRIEVVSKVVPYAAMELVHSYDMGSLVGKLVSSAIGYERCRAFEQVADMKEPFDLSKVKGYRSSYKKDHTQASNDLATTTFPWLDEFVADPSSPIEALLSKKPPTLQRPTPSRTQVPLPSSQRATLSSVPVSNLMYPPANSSIMKPQSSQPH